MVSPLAQSGNLLDRVGRVLRLDRAVFNEVEADSTATGQAWTIVLVAAVSMALAGFIQEVLGGLRFGNAVIALVNGFLAAVIGFVVWAVVVQFIGTRLFGGTASLGEMIRTLGFAYSPNIFSILSGIPLLGIAVSLVLFVWVVLTGFFAVREGLDLDTTKAILTIVISLIIVLVVTFLIASVFTLFALVLGVGGMGFRWGMV
ncbi:MAG: YIP1 family protein [Chloroflexota bacterium]|nr:YIP1 family protein [Dehalococcoidia bacterium]MDW8253440.1 YIP1 family protein [Chloroflexota bacterium]